MQVELPTGLRVDLGENPSPELIGRVKAKITTLWPTLVGKTPEQPPNATTSSTTATPTTRSIGSALGESVMETGRRLGGAFTDAAASEDPTLQALGLPDVRRLAPLLELLSPAMMAGGLAGETYARRGTAGLTPEQGRMAGQLAGGGPALVRGGIGLGGRVLSRVRSGLPPVQRQAAQAAATTESSRRVAENVGAALANVGRVAARPAAGRSARAISQTRMLNREAEAQQAIEAGGRTLAASPAGSALAALNAPRPPPVTLYNAAGRPLQLQPPLPPPVTRAMIPRGVATAEKAGAKAGARAIKFWDTVDSRLGQLGDAAVAKTLARDQDLLTALLEGATPGEAAALRRAVVAGASLKMPWTARQLDVKPAAVASRSLQATIRNIVIAAGIGGATGGLTGAVAAPALGKLLEVTLASPLTGRLLAQAVRQAPGSAEFARTATALAAALGGRPEAPPRTLGRSAQEQAQ